MSILEIYHLDRKKNIHFIKKYIKFIESRKTIHIPHTTHLHHILPKAKDMFPQYKNLKEHTWNGIHLNPREHFIAHWMLSKAFPGSSQGIAFYNMANVLGFKNSKEYEKVKRQHISEMALKLYSEERNKKISSALRGKPKSLDHIKSLTGHLVTEETREKLRKANLGKKLSVEQRQKMSISRTGKKKSKFKIEAKLKIAESKCDFYIVTPRGIFNSHLDAAISYNSTSRRFVLIFQNLDVIPRKKVLSELDIVSKGKTYRELGFSKIPK
jgi:hypothetical protein